MGSMGAFFAETVPVTASQGVDTVYYETPGKPKIICGEKGAGKA